MEESTLTHVLAKPPSLDTEIYTVMSINRKEYTQSSQVFTLGMLYDLYVVAEMCYNTVAFVPWLMLTWW